MDNIFRKNKSIICLGFGALILRIGLTVILLQPHYNVNFDLLRYQDWGRIMYYYGAGDSYTARHLQFGTNPNNQPPGTVYIDSAMYALFQLLIHTPLSITPGLYQLLLKLPSIISDAGIGLCIYFIVLKKTKRSNALLAASLFLFNPVVIYNSAVWGQTDAVNNFLFSLSLLLLFRNKFFLSIFLYTVSLYIKLSLLALFPLLLIIYIRLLKYALTKLLFYFLISACLLFFFTLPVSDNPVLWTTQFFIHNAGGEMPYITNSTFNFWSVLFNPDSFSLVPVSTAVYYGLPLSVWAYILFGVVVIPLFIRLIKSKLFDESVVMETLYIASFAVFLFLPRMHQRYLYPVFPLFATVIGLQKKKYTEYVLLSLLNFINLYIVWHPIDFLPNFMTAIFVHSKIRWGISAFTTLLFVLLYKNIVFNKKRIFLTRYQWIRNISPALEKLRIKKRGK